MGGIKQIGKKAGAADISRCLLLTDIAKESGGAFCFVENADQAPTIFNEKLQGLLKLVAQNIAVTLVPEAPVKMVAQWTDQTGKSCGSHVVA